MNSQRIDIYNNDRVTKARSYLAIKQHSKAAHNIFNALDKQTHRRKRRVIGEVVSARKMQDFEPVMVGQIDIFLRKILASTEGSCLPPVVKKETLVATASKPVNMTSALQYMTIDVVGLLAYGRALNTQTDPENRFFADGLASGNYVQNMRMQYPLLRTLGIFELVPLLLKSVHKNIQRYHLFIESLLRERLAQPPDAHPDLYSTVVSEGKGRTAMDTVGYGGDIRLSELWAESVFFLPAGEFLRYSFLVPISLLPFVFPFLLSMRLPKKMCAPRKKP